MGQYRCYFIGRDGGFARVETAECADDAEAIRWADALLRQDAQHKLIEIWERDRLVERRQRISDK